ncbi:protein mobD [Massilia sp. B-10]|nr:protein mobD [Massilia sp. B-10]
MAKDIWIIGGCKGGVGKSVVTVGVLDAMLAQGAAPLLVESDTSNPDVWKMYHKELPAELVDLDEADGWIDFINICDKHPDAVIVVNTAARNNRGVAAYGETLNNTLAELDRKLITLWVINRQHDSLELLNDYMIALAGSRMHVVRNGYFGAEEKFELYNNSKLRTQVEGAMGQSMTFPDLADRVSDDLYSKRLSITSAMKSLPIGNRAELTRWRTEVHRNLAGLFHGQR